MAIEDTLKLILDKLADQQELLQLSISTLTTKKEVAQIKKEQKENNQPTNDSQKKLDDWYEKKAEEGKKSSMFKSLDIHNN